MEIFYAEQNRFFNYEEPKLLKMEAWRTDEEKKGLKGNMVR
jgi:hypothetical protein